MFRNTDPADVANAIREYAREEKEALRPAPEIPLGNVRLPRMGELTEVELLPSVTVRNRGTLQKATGYVTNRRWEYDGNALVLAVVCKRVWAPPAITRQRFAAVVSISHESADVRLHSFIQQRIRERGRERVRR